MPSDRPDYYQAGINALGSAPSFQAAWVATLSSSVYALSSTSVTYSPFDNGNRYYVDHSDVMFDMLGPQWTFLQWCDDRDDPVWYTVAGAIGERSVHMVPGIAGTFSVKYPAQLRTKVYNYNDLAHDFVVVMSGYYMPELE